MYVLPSYLHPIIIDIHDRAILQRFNHGFPIEIIYEGQLKQSTLMNNESKNGSQRTVAPSIMELKNKYLL